MSTNQDILSLLEDYQIQDDFLAEKYENLSTQKRALIKTSIAFQFSFHKTKCEEEQYFSNKNSSFFYGIHTKPAPFLLCVLEEGFASPAKLLSILCPAVIAGVENIYIFLAPNMSDSILASLELSGMENIYILDIHSNNINSSDIHSNNINSSDIHSNTINENTHQNLEPSISQNIFLINSCLKYLSNEFPHEKGRVILFSKDENKNTFLTQVEESTQELAIPSYIDNYNPSIYAKKENHDLVNFAYTYPIIKENTPKENNIDNININENKSLAADCPKQSEETSYQNKDDFTTLRQDASAKFVTTGQSITDISFIPHLLGIQNYGDAMELCYIHPTINIDFFLNKKISAQLCFLDA